MQMKTNNQPQGTREQQVSLLLTSENILTNLLDRQDEIIALIQRQNDKGLDGYISEKQAMQIINKKSTWFWQMRKNGEIPYKKIGKTIYYSRIDLESLLKNGNI
jgi:hypothetical protein